VNKKGEYGAAGYGWNMTYSVFDKTSNQVREYTAVDIKPK